MEKIKNILRHPVLWLFALFIIGFSIFDMTQNDREFSDLENRYLEQKPKFTIKSLVSNEYTLDYEEYINDQFALRDSWIDLKSRCEYLFGKIENNGIAYGKDGQMFEKYQTTNDARIERNIDFVKSFIEKNADKNITFSIIPNAYTILEDKVPTGLNNVDQEKYIQSLYDQLDGYENLQTLNFIPLLRQHKDEYIFYRTDHHWTTYAAYLAYQSYCQQKGLTPVDVNRLQSHEIKDFYGTFYSKTKLFNTISDTIVYYDIPSTSVLVDYEEVDGFYDYSKLEERDKYAFFMRGNNGLTIIKSDNNLDKKDHLTRVLIIKDSYSNCLIPFLTYNYDEVYVVDLRSLGAQLSNLMEQTEFDDILIFYNFMNFASDTNISFLKY